MSSSITDALKCAGLKINNDFIEWGSISDVKLPFGSCVNTSDSDMGSEIYRNELRSFNFFRRNATEFKLSDFYVRSKDYVTEFLKKNGSKCRLLPKPSCRSVNNGYLGKHTSWDERDIERDAAYGATDIVCMFVYSAQYETFYFRFHFSALNSSIPEQWELKSNISRKFDSNILYGYDNDNEKYRELFDYCVKYVFPRCEFIPVEISIFDGCTISHKEYRDPLYGKKSAVTSPCLGKNIKKHEEFVNRLSGWLESGGYIRDDMFYLILEDWKKEGKPLYLRPWKV